MFSVSFLKVEEVIKFYVEKFGGVLGFVLIEVFFGVLMMVYIMSGVVMGIDVFNGVVDSLGEVFGY